MSGQIMLRNMTSVYFTTDTHVLCLYRMGSKIADNLFIGSAGGHFEKEEMRNPYACILREIKEELSLTEDDFEPLRLRYITNRLKNGEIRVNYYYFTRLITQKPLKSTEGLLKWVSYADLPSLEMPVSAKQMILHYASEGRFTDHLYGCITSEENTVFHIMREF